ncbi:MAG: 1-acyl-sn-glycerol-3-phosphate acyltransferase [Nannocystaceae bacterium]|nr:1-acyl-sn-glycerol-3-phosphate acyltransferase [Nannocystaceae bacterium]
MADRSDKRRRFELRDVLLYPWSLVVWGFGLGWLGLLVLTALPLMLVVRFERFQTLWIHPMVGWVLWVGLSPVRVFHDPRYRRDRGVVFVQNHVSMLDAYAACAAIRVPLCGLENAAHLKIPGYGWLMRAANAVPVTRGAGQFARIATLMRDRVRRGISVLTFPEAHRTLDGQLRPFKRGVFQIARDAGIPVVPLAVRGMYEMLPKGAFLIRPSRIDIYMGPPLPTEGLSDEELDVLMERVRTIIIDWVEHGRMAPTEP